MIFKQISGEILLMGIDISLFSDVSIVKNKNALKIAGLIIFKNYFTMDLTLKYLNDSCPIDILLWPLMFRYTVIQIYWKPNLRFFVEKHLRRLIILPPCFRYGPGSAEPICPIDVSIVSR